MRLTLHQFDAVSEIDAEYSPPPDGAAGVNARPGKCDVLFIHGTGSSAEMWHPQVQLLTALGYRCFVIDLRGHGKSHEPGEHTDLAVHKADVIETLENSPIKFPAVFVGHSLGSILSITLAEERPEMVALIFGAGFPGRILRPVTFFFLLFMKYVFEPLKARNWHLNWPFRPRTLLNTEKHSLDQIVKNFADLDYVSNLPQVRCRVHLASGFFDPVAPYVYAHKIHKALPDSTFRTFFWGGHNFMDTHPKQFNNWLLKGLHEFEQAGQA